MKVVSYNRKDRQELFINKILQKNNMELPDKI